MQVNLDVHGASQTADIGRLAEQPFFPSFSWFVTDCMGMKPRAAAGCAAARAPLMMRGRESPQIHHHRRIAVICCWKIFEN